MSRAYQTEKIPNGKTISSAYRLRKLLELGRGAARRSTSSGARSRTDDNGADGASTDSGNSGGGFDSHARYESDWATYADYHQGGGPKPPHHLRPPRPKHRRRLAPRQIRHRDLRAACSLAIRRRRCQVMDHAFLQRVQDSRVARHPVQTVPEALQAHRPVRRLHRAQRPQARHLREEQRVRIQHRKILDRTRRLPVRRDRQAGQRRPANNPSFSGRILPGSRKGPGIFGRNSEHHGCVDAASVFSGRKYIAGIRAKMKNEA